MKPILAIAILLLAALATGCDTPGVASAGASPAEPTKVQHAASEKSEKSNRLLDRSFDDIIFDIEPDAPFERGMLTEEIEDLNGKRIKIRGYILPTAQKRGIKQFVLVRDNMECCFGPGAALYDCILVEMQPGRSAEFSIFPVAVTGEFRVDAFEGPEGRTLAVFQMRGEEVE